MQNTLKNYLLRIMCLTLALTSVLLSPVSVQAEETIPNTKAYTVTKKAEGATEETTQGEYDTFMECISAIDINDATSQYTVYVNRDTVIPAEEGFHGRTNNKIRLTSGVGGPFTLTRKGDKNIIDVNGDCEFTIDNIILDGNQESECLSVLGNGKVTIGSGAVIQNFIDSPTYVGPALYVASQATLIIEEGATIRNNVSNSQGGAIQVRQEATLTIKGGTFENNISLSSQGGAIAAYGKLNITGGTFKGNKAKKVGGAIIIGKTHPATIENATFIENEASTGGAIYSSQDITIQNTTFEKNKANWGGAIYTIKNLVINKSTFRENMVKGAGGALYLNKNNGAAQITQSNFINNVSKQDGGAIYTWLSDDKDPIVSTTAYTNISTDENTLFRGNVAQNGRHTPPQNYADYTNLLFHADSDAAQDNNYRKSLLNNADINYENPFPYVYFQNGDNLCAGVKVERGKSIASDAFTDQSMPANPSKDGYTFKQWNTAADGSGDTFTEATLVNTDITVYAIYTKNPEPTPTPKRKAVPATATKKIS